MIHFEQLDHATEKTDKFGDNTGPGELFNLQAGIIKIKLSGNGRVYCHAPYSNLSEETINLKKGKSVGSLSLVDEVLISNSNTKLVNTATKQEAEDKDKDYSDPIIRHEYIKKLLVGKCEDSRYQQLVEQLF